MTSDHFRRIRRHARPHLEGLEDRKLLYATLGANWAYGSRITYSFAPDGTNIGGVSSALFSSMSNRGFSTSQWQGAFQKAAAAWQAATNINLVLVSDDGTDFGDAGNQQSDSRFGDIRIGGTELSSSVLATAFLPPAFNGGTLAGDIVMNTTQAWQINNDYDLQTVAIHEFGHSLGLDHSAISTATMYGGYNAKKQSLTSDDTAGIRAVYGVRAADAFDAAASNNTSGTATNITSLLNTDGQVSIASLDITANTDSDWYVVTAPSDTTGTLKVTMQSSNLSSLSPKVLVYNSSLQGLASATAANTFGATVTVTISNVTAGQTFYVRSMAANGGITGIGSYGLQINFGAGTMDPVQPPDTTVAAAPDQGGGSSNQSIGDGEMVTVGTIEAMGDALTVDPYYLFARQLTDGDWDVSVVFVDPAQAEKIQKLVDRAQAAASKPNAQSVRSAVITAIDRLLERWDD